MHTYTLWLDERDLWSRSLNVYDCPLRAEVFLQLYSLRRDENFFVRVLLLHLWSWTANLFLQWFKNSGAFGLPSSLTEVQDRRCRYWNPFTPHLPKCLKTRGISLTEVLPGLFSELYFFHFFLYASEPLLHWCMRSLERFQSSRDGWEIYLSRW